MFGNACFSKHHWLPQKQGLSVQQHWHTWEASPYVFLISKDQWSMFKSVLNSSQSAADLRLKSALYSACPCPACLIDTALLYCRVYSGVDDGSRSSSTHKHRENQAYEKCISSWPDFYLSPGALSHPGDHKGGDSTIFDCTYAQTHQHIVSSQKCTFTLIFSLLMFRALEHGMIEVQIPSSRALHTCLLYETLLTLFSVHKKKGL